ncbi:MAG: trypsin-like peptidase domain-containing protein [Planctomycetota bacterium]
MRRFVSALPAAMMLTAAVGTLVLAPKIVRSIEGEATLVKVRLAEQALTGDDILERIDRAQTAIAEAVGPGVVHIESMSRRGSYRGRSSSGTGWVFDGAGHIVTNAHVVRGSDSVRVQFSNGRTLRGTVVGSDEITDIAVLEVDPFSGLAPLRRASDVEPRKGQQVYAFGSPFGFKFSMSSGMVSGLGRDPGGAVLDGAFTNFIQHDAAVNPGNSGGPLVDIYGRLVGMNVAIATGRSNDGTTIEGGQSAGISFAIPVAVIDSVAAQLIERGEVRRGFLGISLPPGTTEIEVDRTFWGVGVQIRDSDNQRGVTPGGAADRAGIRTGDIIAEFNGKRVPSIPVLRSWISSSSPGDRIDLTVFREDRFITIPVNLGEFPSETLAQGPVDDVLRSIGFTLQNRSLRARPLIARVGEGTTAQRLGLEQGMLIESVEGQPVNTLADAIRSLDRAGLLRGVEVDVRVSRAMSDDAPFDVTLRRPR